MLHTGTARGSAGLFPAVAERFASLARGVVGNFLHGAYHRAKLPLCQLG
jgi:hypothetical protein